MSNQERRLMRRMANAHGAMEARAPRGGLIGSDPEYIREQQDRDRTRLAEQLLEIGLEECSISSFTDTFKPVPVGAGERSYVDSAASLTLKEWYVKHAEAALAAAEVIYPELPEPGALGSQLLPAAAQAGAQSVGGFPEERPMSVEALRNAPGGQLRGEG